MENFVKIAKGLDVAPALAELMRQPDHVWLKLDPDASRCVPLLAGLGERQFEAELPEVWRLIGRARHPRGGP